MPNTEEASYQLVDIVILMPSERALPMLRDLIKNNYDRVAVHALRRAAYDTYVGTLPDDSERLKALLLRLADGPDEDLRARAAQKLGGHQIN